MTRNVKTAAATMTFMMGLPAAGKSTWRRANLVGNVIDPDEVKETHPDYDPKNPHPLHAWSKGITDAMFADALVNVEGHHIIDGTGTNAEKMVRRIREAAEAGYATQLVFVKCTLDTSLERNAARARNVPEDVVRQKAEDIATAYDIVSTMAPLNEIIIIDND